MGLLKIATVAVVWAVITVNVAMVISEISLTHDAWIEAIQRFLLVLVLMVPFEIRDMHKDAAELHTLPQLVGVLNAKRIALALSILLYALTFFKTEITAMDVWGKLLLTLLLLLAIVFTKTKRSKRFASFWVEGIPIIWLGVLVLLENYF